MAGRTPKSQRGQGMLEYVVVVMALIGVMSAPIVPNPNGEDFVSVLTLFVEVFDIYINSFHTVVSLPIP